MIIWILVITILGNFIGALLAPKKAKAVDASDYMLLFWPSSNCADTPSGWTAVSDGVGEAFYQRFPRGAATYSAAAGGNTAHTHTATVTTTAVTAGATIRRSGANAGASSSHTHTANTASVDSPANSSVPLYGDMCVIRYDNGIPHGNSAIPNGAVAIFDAAVPAGWSDYSSTFRNGSDRFIRGGTNATGGNNTHGGTGHSITNVVLNTVNGTTNGDTSTSTFATTTHTHSGTSAGVTSNTPNTEPPYRKIYIGQKTNAGPIPNAMIAMFEDTDSSVGFSVAGWTRMSDATQDFNNRFLKVTGDYSGTGGATTHTHDAMTATSGARSGTATGRTGTGGPADTHTHDLSISLADGSNTNLPPYTDVVIAKKQTVMTTLSTDKGSYGGGETISVSTTVNNYHSTDALNDKYIDAVIFIDANASGAPDAGETYITNGCAGSGVWASGNYTHQNTNVDAAAGGSANDNWTCGNSSFPSNTTYTLWARWWDGSSYAYNIYYDKSVTFTSVPTLTEILFVILIGCMVFLGVKTGVIKLKKDKNNDPKSHQNNPKLKRSTDGIQKKIPNNKS